MKDKNTFYITTPIFYPNANLHMGHAYTTVLSDIISRYSKLTGKGTYFLTGSDENAEKIVRAAKAAGKDTVDYLDEITGNFKNLFSDLGISYDQFIRTSDKEVHFPGAEEMWRRLSASGDIEKRSYEGLYCVGHESFVTEKDLDEDGKCPDHGTKPEVVKEENYFFKLSKYTDKIREKIESGELEVIPQSRKNEILSVLKDGLEDVSFSRPADKMSVGIPVPGDSTQKMYVWCDALTNYVSALGFGREDDELFKKFWPADVHVIGKDILRFHGAIWPGMLLSAGLPLPRKILVHGFIKSGGKKMSKTLGNVIDPAELVKEYGAEAVRYYLARHISPFEDGDITLEKFKEVYNANLANGLGNLVSRVMKMAEKHVSEYPNISESANNYELSKGYRDAMEEYNIQKASDIVWMRISKADEKIQETQPFKLVKTDKEKAVQIIKEMVIELYTIGRMLNPIMPETSKIIKEAVKANKKPDEPIFPRK
ncbi:MAG: methionine--tRNA ligase [Parcubacteria group bacterium CG11_big_fil_rev_8_21_14_0_20_39_22]|nr:MAG: methionine--tRNA ligase [Parcubacteria group bacterium CG11_big_fil_rev_8_21_14_0_20_39_22]